MKNTTGTEFREENEKKHHRDSIPFHMKGMGLKSRSRANTKGSTFSSTHSEHAHGHGAHPGSEPMDLLQGLAKILTAYFKNLNLELKTYGNI